MDQVEPKSTAKVTAKVMVTFTGITWSNIKVKASLLGYPGKGTSPMSVFSRIPPYLHPHIGRSKVKLIRYCIVG